MQGKALLASVVVFSGCALGLFACDGSTSTQELAPAAQAAEATAADSQPAEAHAQATAQTPADAQSDTQTPGDATQTAEAPVGKVKVKVFNKAGKLVGPF